MSAHSQLQPLRDSKELTPRFTIETLEPMVLLSVTCGTKLMGGVPVYQPVDTYVPATPPEVVDCGSPTDVHTDYAPTETPTKCDVAPTPKTPDKLDCDSTPAPKHCELTPVVHNTCSVQSMQTECCVEADVPKTIDTHSVKPPSTSDSHHEVPSHSLPAYEVSQHEPPTHPQKHEVEPRPTSYDHVTDTTANNNDAGDTIMKPIDETADTTDTPDEAIVLEVRSYDGTGNNPIDALLGSTNTQQLRLGPINYADGRGAIDDAGLPSAREISNIVHDQDGSVVNNRAMSDYAWAWAQFIDHDITLTDIGDTEPLPIAVPAGDEHFDPAGLGNVEMEFHRSVPTLDVDGIRQYENQITAFVDGSVVYGSDAETVEQLRAHEAGLMAMTEDGFLQTVVGNHGPEFLSGDVRANENAALTSLHTLFTREHNRIATEIASTEYVGADLTDSEIDEAIFQRARTIVGAEIQAITYNEFLPTLLGEDAIDHYQGYDANADPSISLEFSTAGYRVGHTLLSPELLRVDDYGNEIDAGHLSLRDAFFDTTNVTEAGIDPILRGLASQEAQEVDTQIIGDVRNFLLLDAGGEGFDLAALNIQRGRDHGIGSYNEVRMSLGLDAAECFHDITCDAEVAAALKAAYGDVDNVELWVGGLAEDHVEGASVGETFQVLIADQFERLRDGDRFYYENALSSSDLCAVEHTTLADVIRWNTDVKHLSDDVFTV